MVEWTCRTRKAIDSDHYFVVCFNLLIGCYGSTGPSSVNPETGSCYGSAFPTFLFQARPRSRDFFWITLGSINFMPLPGPRLVDSQPSRLRPISRSG